MRMSDWSSYVCSSDVCSSDLAWAPRQEQPMTTASKVLAETDTEAARALRIIEGMPGHAWSADAAGRFTYISPNTLAFLGEARENLNTSDDEDEFGWRRVVHPDDYDRVVARRTGDRDGG